MVEEEEEGKIILDLAIGGDENVPEPVPELVSFTGTLRGRKANPRRLPWECGGSMLPRSRTRGANRLIIPPSGVSLITKLAEPQPKRPKPLV